MGFMDQGFIFTRVNVFFVFLGFGSRTSSVVGVHKHGGHVS
jgi:hypothetical protein